MRSGKPIAPTIPLGALPRDDGTVEVRVLAPRAERLGVRLGGRAPQPLRRVGPRHEGAVAGRPGDAYRFVLEDGRELADPCSRAQPEGVSGPSGVVAPAAPVTDGWGGIDVAELVLYELHVGTFTEEGTFDAAIPHLPALRVLGVTAIELMPVATFPGQHGWGYDGVYGYAPHPVYGGPEGLRRLVAAAHAAGLGVVLDVVYNHLGPGGDVFGALAPYLDPERQTPWGDAMNFDGDGSLAAREWAIQNACMWVREYGVDGLRLDAVHAIVDESPRHVLAELADRVHAESPHALVMAETAIGDRRPVEAFGHDAQWADGFHHALHALLTGERDGYYAEYGRVADLARELERPDASRLVYCAQNHDQVGNRALGDRLPPEAMRVAAACLLFAPGIPLLFMGEEYGERAPFQFFADHPDPLIADATREGRRREFASFAGFDGDLPDPLAPETFERSKLTRRELPGVRERYRELLRVRQGLPPVVETSVDEDRRTLVVRRGDAELRVDFERLTAEIAA